MKGQRHPGRLYHDTPGWVKAGAVFHLRGRCGQDNERHLTDPAVAPILLESVRHYHERGRWHARLFLLMPDHWHALLSFAVEERMSSIVGDWKRFQAGRSSIQWQDGYFDHRIRNEKELEEKSHYIRMNPVAKGLCARPEDWPWKIEHIG
jgi:REP element-mobilizing transposase RayT